MVKATSWPKALSRLLPTECLEAIRDTQNGIFNKAIVGACPKEVPYSDFLAEVGAGHMAEFQITERTLLGILKEEKPNSGLPAPAHMLKATRLPGMEETTLLKDLDAHGVKFFGKIESGSAWTYALLSWVLPLLVMAAI